MKAGHQSDRVVIEYTGDDRLLRDIEGTDVVNSTAGRIELRMMGDDMSTERLLKTAIDKVSISKFELEEPSLHDIFVNSVTSN